MTRQRLNNQGGTLGASLTSGGVTITFAAAPGFATLTSPDYYAITLEPGTTNEEIVALTAYTAGATTGTITRGQEGSTAVAHGSGVAWAHGPTKYDFDTLLLDGTSQISNVYGQNVQTGRGTGNSSAPIQLDASDQAYMNDATHDFLAALFVNNYTADGTGITLNNQAAGDGVYAQAIDTMNGWTSPPNAINAFAGQSSWQNIDSGSGGTVTYTATTLTDTSKAWTVNVWAKRWVTVGNTHGYIVSNTATVLTVRGWVKNSGGAAGAGQIADVTPAAGAAYSLPQSNSTGVNIQVNGSGAALKVVTSSGCNPAGDALQITMNSNARAMFVNDFASTTGATWAITATAKTTGQFINVYQATSNMSGDCILFNCGNSSTFTGTFMRGQLAGVDKFSADVSRGVRATGLRVFEGSNAKQGTATLVGGTVTVSNTSVTANSRIFLTSQVDGGTPGYLRVSARVAGTSFTVTSGSALDTSTFAYQIFEPA